MIKRLVIIQVLLLGGLSLVFLLPRTPPTQPVALKWELPDDLATGWTGLPLGFPSKEEKEILADDTEFLRRDYKRRVPGSEQKGDRYDSSLVDVLNASIVLSGKDLTNSIHALERCLGSQGFNITSASTMRIKLSSGQTMAVRRLACEKELPKTRQISRSISYYWFVGHDYVTSNHVKRGLKDFKDRVLSGYDQRWAYITVTANLDSGPVTFAPKAGAEPVLYNDPATGGPLQRRAISEADADRLVNGFIADLGPDIIRTDWIKEWPEE